MTRADRDWRLWTKRNEAKGWLASDAYIDGHRSGSWLPTAKALAAVMYTSPPTAFEVEMAADWLAAIRRLRDRRGR